MAMLCPKCRHPVHEPEIGSSRPRCPNCGHRLSPDIGPAAAVPGVPAAPPGPVPAGASEGWAVASLVCGLVFFVPVVSQILAIVFGAVALRRLHRRPGQSTARVMAVIGMTCGLLAGLMWGWIGITFYPFFRTGPVATVPATPGPVALGYASYTGVANAPQNRSGRVTEAKAKMKEVLQGLTEYRQDHRRWPQTLDDLIPTYLETATLHLENFDVFGRQTKPVADTEGLVRYVRPPSDVPESEKKRILLYSMRFEYDDEGQQVESAKRWVVWTNGRIELMEEQGVAQALQQPVESLGIKPYRH